MAERPRTLLHIFPTFAVGGAQMRLVQLANHFGSQYRHRIAAMDGITGAFGLLTPGLDAEMLPVENHRGESLRNVMHFRKQLRQLKPDLLVTSNWGTIEWAIANRFSRTPHVHMEDGFGPDESGHQFARRVWARRILLRKSTTVVPSDLLYAIARDTWRLPANRIVQVTNGVDCTRFRSPPDVALLDNFNVARDRPVIGAVAPLRTEKNLARLIEAFAELRRQRNAQLVIVGEGPLRESLQRQAAGYGLNEDVVFTGFCPTPEKLLPAFSVFAISSDTEQMPLSLLEAMAAARPVAATRVGDICHMVSEENRPFIVEKNAPALSAALMRLLDDPIKASTIGAANARRAADTFDQQRMFTAYRALFDQATPPSSGPNILRASTHKAQNT